MVNSTISISPAPLVPRTGRLVASPVLQRAQFRLSIAALRGQRVILDGDLAALYGVETKRFNEQVKRNGARFPADFMFQISAAESESSRSQFATLKTGRGQHRKYLPRAAQAAYRVCHAGG